METQHQLIARRAAQELQDGGVVHLGKGIPSLVTQFVPSGIEVMLLDEAGQLSLLQSAVLPNGNTTQPISPEQDSPVDKACSFFSVEEAFVMIRGGHLDIAIMDADEVDESGNLANWMVPGKRVYGVGALMDLAVGGKRVVVAMEHKAKDQKPKILRNCRLPMTALGVVDRIITEMAVMDVTPEGLLLREIAPGLSVDEVTRSTEADLKVDKDLKMIQI
ncbi:MAG: CoA-transferase [Terriglobia bacterium]